MKRKNSTVFGGLLIVIGMLFLVSGHVLNLELLNFGNGDFWPIFVLGLGLIFELIFFETRRRPGLLIPGGILTILGLLFFFEVTTSWVFSTYTWPVYVFSVAVGFFQLYFFGNRNIGTLISALILTMVAVMAMMVMLFNLAFNTVDLGLALPIVSILVGFVLIFEKSFHKQQKTA